MKRLILLLALLNTPTYAQQAQVQSTAADRLAVTLGQCVGQAEAKHDQIMKLEIELAQLKAKLKELEEKKDAKQ